MSQQSSMQTQGPSRMPWQSCSGEGSLQSSMPLSPRKPPDCQLNGQDHPVHLDVCCRQPFAAAAEQHLAALAAQLLAAQRVTDVATWCPIVTCLALGAAAAVSPTAMAAQGTQDPSHYIKVHQLHLSQHRCRADI